MKIAFLNCDHVRPEFLHIGGDYPAMLSRVSGDLKFTTYHVCDGHFPENVLDFEGYIVNGSSKSVYDKIDWVLKLKDFVRQIYAANLRYIGICFGHQMLAEALGGVVRKAENGWCVGVHTFEVVEKEAWMNPEKAIFQVLMSCQDQVLQLPKRSTILAQSANCPIGMFRVGTTMLGIQGHPDFQENYLRSLMNSRVERIGKATYQEGLASFEKELDSQLLFRWLRNFLENP